MRCRQALMMRIELFWRCLVCALLAGTAHTATLCPSETNLQYVGRWDVSTATKPWAQAQGATLIARFTGTSVVATLDLLGGESLASSSTAQRRPRRRSPLSPEFPVPWPWAWKRGPTHSSSSTPSR